MNFPIVMKAQNALGFDGINDRVDAGNSTSVQISGTQITIEAWIKPSAFGPNVWSNSIVNKEVWTPQQGYMLRCGSGGKLSFNLGFNSTWYEIVSTNNVLAINTWAHVAGVYDGSYMRLYVNGICTDSISKTGSFSDGATANLIIGDNWQIGRTFSGAIDEVKVWNTARTKAQIQANMNTEMCGGALGLKAYFKFNQGIASGNNAAITTATNSVPNSTNGIMTGFSLTGSSSNFVLGQALSIAPNSSNDTIYSVICQGDVYPFGSLNLTNAGTYHKTYYTATGCDSNITLILTVNPNTTVNLIDTICTGETYHLGTQALIYSGNYTQTFTQTNGCDSTINLALHVKPVDLSASIINGMTISLIGIGTYQWLDCDDNYSVIAGANAQSYSPPTIGNYAAIVTQNGCSDTTVCLPITVVDGIENIKTVQGIDIFPNPSLGVFTIHQNISPKDFRVIVLNSLGESVFNKTYDGLQTEVDLSHLYNGVYYVWVITPDKSASAKLVILK